MMRSILLGLVPIILCCFGGSRVMAAATPQMRIGVTLPAYYSWVSAIVRDKAEVVPVLPASADPHSYQPSPEDLLTLNGLNVLISNGLGHDAYIESMLRALAVANIQRIDPNQNVPLLPLSTQTDANGWNSHSFLSITSAIQQIGHIALSLGRLDPENSSYYQQNARLYVKKLRAILASFLTQLAPQAQRINLATVHDGYAYLFQDLGLSIDSVIQPRHGIDPTPKQLADTVKRLKNHHVQILFTEIDYGRRFDQTVSDEAGIVLVQLDHMASGPYTPEKFELGMRQNLQQIVSAINGHVVK